MLEKGTTFVIGSWVCIANGSGGFTNHLADTRMLEAYAPTSRCDIDELAKDLGEIQLSNLIGNHDNKYGPNPTPTHDRYRLQLLSGLSNTTTVY